MNKRTWRNSDCRNVDEKRTGKQRKVLTRLCINIFLMLMVMQSIVFAQELSLLGGVINNLDEEDTSWMCQAEYWSDIERVPTAWSLSYLNEGHFDDDHRDGLAAQIWLPYDVEKLTLAVGVGPYLFCDTTDHAGDDYANEHGIGLLTGLAVKWAVVPCLKLQCRGNWIVTEDMDTLSVLLGLSYVFDEPDGHYRSRRISPVALNDTLNEVSVFSGITVVNSFDSEDSMPIALEYRRRLTAHFEWTFTGLYEGSNDRSDRGGPAAQIWLVEQPGDWPVLFGLGVGPYLVFEREEDVERECLAGLVSLSAGYRFGVSSIVRVSWHRVVTDYNRDTDIVLAGVGCRF
jgi:hypothetical protein